MSWVYRIIGALLALLGGWLVTLAAELLREAARSFLQRFADASPVVVASLVAVLIVCGVLALVAAGRRRTAPHA